MIWDVDSGKFQWEEELSNVSLETEQKGVDHLLDRQSRIIFSDQINTVGECASLCSRKRSTTTRDVQGPGISNIYGMGTKAVRTEQFQGASGPANQCTCAIIKLVNL